MACKCGSNRIMLVDGKCADTCNTHVDYLDIRYCGYVPHGLGIGGGDYIRFRVCLDCGTIQDFPVKTGLEIKDALGLEEESEDEESFPWVEEPPEVMPEWSAPRGCSHYIVYVDNFRLEVYPHLEKDACWSWRVWYVEADENHLLGIESDPYYKDPGEAQRECYKSFLLFWDKWDGDPATVQSTTVDADQEEDY